MNDTTNAYKLVQVHGRGVQPEGLPEALHMGLVGGVFQGQHLLHIPQVSVGYLLHVRAPASTLYMHVA